MGFGQKFKKCALFNYLIQVMTTKSLSSFCYEQHMIIQEESVAVAELPASIAAGAQIIGIGGSVEALDTREVQPQEAYSTVVAGEEPSLDDVV